MAIPFNGKWQAKDGSLHDNIWDADAATRRYDLELERNKLLKQQEERQREQSRANESYRDKIERKYRNVDRRTNTQIKFDAIVDKFMLIVFIIVGGIVAVNVFNMHDLSLSVFLFMIGMFAGGCVHTVLLYLIVNPIFRPRGEISDEEANKYYTEVNERLQKQEKNVDEIMKRLK